MRGGCCCNRSAVLHHCCALALERLVASNCHKAVHLLLWHERQQAAKTGEQTAAATPESRSACVQQQQLGLRSQLRDYAGAKQHTPVAPLSLPEVRRQGCSCMQ